MTGALATIETPHGPATLPRPTCSLPGGLTGYYQPPRQCLRAAVATVTQIPLSDVPAEFTRVQLQNWIITRRRLLIRYWQDGWLPIEEPLWIGITELLAPDPSTGKRYRHAVVCRGEQIIFDPQEGWVYPNGLVGLTLPSQIEQGMSFHPLKEE